MSRPNLKLGSILFVVAFAASAVLLYGGAKLVGPGESAKASGGEGGSSGGPAGGPVLVRLVAKDLKFDKRQITASPGVDVTVTLDNQDPGVSHNVAFYTNSRATEKIAVGALIAGPATEDVKFKAPSSAGNYFFRCDAHTDMTGAFIVK